MIKDKMITVKASYENAFWNNLSLRGESSATDILNEGFDPIAGGFALPDKAEARFFAELRNRDFLRRYASVFKLPDFKTNLCACDSEEPADFYDECEAYPIEEIKNQFHLYNLKHRKMATLCRIPEEFVSDCGINLEEYLPKHIARKFAKAEEKAFLNGGNPKKPQGILEDEVGAMTGVTSVSENAITYDEVISLYFSLDKEYRSDAIWVMNDETALYLRKLKDEDGNPLWDKDKNTILGKKVEISNYMPGIEAGKKCIAFGDFSYYWILDLSRLCIRDMKELFARQNAVGYYVVLFLDCKLVRRDAIKVLKVAESE